MQNKRIDWIDRIKGFAILLVVLGHVCNARFSPTMSGAVQLIYSFHMPLFMFVSGMMSAGALRVKQWGDYTERRAIRLWIPYLFWGILNCVCHRNNVWTEFALCGGGFYWYLPTLFWYTMWLTAIIMVCRLTERCHQPHKHAPWLLPFCGLILTTAICAFLWLLPGNTIFYGLFGIYWQRRFFLYFMAGVGYAWLGMPAIRPLAGVGALILFLTTYWLHIPVVPAPLAIIACLSAAQNLELRKATRINTWGQYSLSIYCVHYLLLALVPHKISQYTPIPPPRKHQDSSLLDMHHLISADY